MRVIRQVTCCADCPLFSESAFCQHPLKPERADTWDGGDNDPWQQAPKWCPLRVGELLISLRSKS